jgi:hypothetical protein
LVYCSFVFWIYNFITMLIKNDLELLCGMSSFGCSTFYDEDFSDIDVVAMTELDIDINRD